MLAGTLHITRKAYVVKGTDFVSGEAWAENPGFPFIVDETVCETVSLAE